MAAIPVELTLDDFWNAIGCVRARQKSAASAGLNHATTYPRDFLKRLEEEVIGACGERALGKLLDESWGTVNTFHKVGDVAGIEVRATGRDNGRLILRQWEVNQTPELLDRIFVFVTGRPPMVRVVGWLRGKEITRPEWLDDPNDFGRPCYMAPQSALHDPEALVAWWRRGRKAGA